MTGTYKPTEHGGLREDGQPDKRVGTGEFAHGKVDPHEAGKDGGHTSGTSNDYNNSDKSGGTRSSDNHGQSGGSAKGQFAHGKVDPHEAGRKGGKKSGTTGDDE